MMSATGFNSTVPDLHADDDEISRHADLLDNLEVGLLAFSPDGSICLRNRTAETLLGLSAPGWQDENGVSIPDEQSPSRLTLLTGEPVADRILSLDDTQGNKIWLSVNAIPVLSATGSVRRVLVTLDDITDLREMQHEISRLTTFDTVTGTLNAQTISNLLEIEIRRAQRYGTPFSVAHVIIDLFEDLCEKLGHEIGDQVLSGVGHFLNRGVREMDMVGRVGRNEFLLILPNARLHDAIIGMERLRSMIEVETFSERSIFITISGGIAEYAGENATALIERSRSLLLNAGEAGRNRFCLDSDII